MVRKMLTVCMAVLLLCAWAIPVSAEAFDSEKTGAISVTLTEKYDKTPIAGAELSVYYIATVGINTDGKLNYIYTDTFADTAIAIDDPDLATKLDTYLSEKQVTALVLRTDAQGTASCTDLPLGLYLVRQTNTVAGYAACAPFLVTVPMQDADSFTYAVNAAPKMEMAKLTNITVKKVWNTDASTKIADSVTIQLLHGETVIRTATLSPGNNWQVTYTEMPQSDAYSVKEINTPKGFTATYKQSGFVFTVTNTSTLAQTGQLIWPIPVLAFVGVLLLAAGSLLLRKKREENA